MTCLDVVSEDMIMSILDYLNYEDLFYKEKTIISKQFHNIVQRLLTISKTENGISYIFLSLNWEKNELEKIPIILFSPNKFGSSLKSRLFDIFESKEPHKKLFISNIFTNKLSFMIKPLDNKILFIEFLDNNLKYNVYTQPPKYRT
jgi:hypothetical protein